MPYAPLSAGLLLSKLQVNNTSTNWSKLRQRKLRFPERAQTLVDTYNADMITCTSFPSAAIWATEITDALHWQHASK